MEASNKVCLLKRYKFGRCQDWRTTTRGDLLVPVTSFGFSGIPYLDDDCVGFLLPRRDEETKPKYSEQKGFFDPSRHRHAVHQDKGFRKKPCGKLYLGVRTLREGAFSQKELRMQNQLLFALAIIESHYFRIVGTLLGTA